MPKKFEDFNNPRKKALAGMKQSISAELWDKNLNFLTQLRAALLHKDLKCKAPLIEPNLRRNLGKW
ncbi:hypothetical protein BTH03_00620, partial [Acinetobacter baumannii]